MKRQASPLDKLVWEIKRLEFLGQAFLESP
jgi:hypothetical protein